MFGQYAAFVIPCYVATFIAFAALIIRARMNHNRQKEALARLGQAETDG